MALLGLCAQAAQPPPPQPTPILMLVSYHAGLAWSDDQIAAVKSQLQPVESAIALRVDFLDTKHVPPTPEYYQRMEALLLAKYGPTPPKMMLAVDDDALDFALGMRQHHFPGVPILFSGIAASRRPELAREAAVAGVFDDVDVAQSVSVMLGLLPRTRRLVVVHDQSRTSLAQVQSVRQVLEGRKSLQVRYLTDLDVATIQTRLGALGGTDLVFQLAFNRDAAGRVLSHEEASDLWAAASTAPVAVTRDVSMRPGILGGHLITGRQQGETLGKLALKALLNANPTEMGMVAGTALPTFDYAQLRRWGIADSALPPDAVVLNRPPGAMTALRPHLPWLGSLFGGMLVVIALLVHGIRVRRRSEDALRQSAQNYRELFNSNTDAIVVRDAATGAVVETNPRFHSMFGYAAADIGSLSPARLSVDEAPYSAADAERWIEKALRDGPQFFEWRSRRSDGSLFWSEISLTRYQAPDGLRIVSTVRDVSDRKLAETQAREFAHHIHEIYQHLPVAVLAIDSAHRVTFWNTQLELITGVKASEVVGTTETWRGIYPTPRPCLADLVVDLLPSAELQRLYEGKLQRSTIVTNAVEGEDYFPNVNQGRGMWLRFCAAPLHNADGDLVGAIESIADVTALKLSQHTLEELNHQLESRVTARTHELERTMGQLVQSRKMAALGSLVAGVAHELNTPLGVVITVASTLSEQLRGFNQLLASGTARRSEVNSMVGDMLEAGRMIERNAVRAAKLVTDFKQVAEVHAQAQPQRLDLTRMVMDLVNTMAPQFLEQTHQLCVDAAPPLWITSHPLLLERVLTEILTNAMRHGLDGRRFGEVRLSLRDEPGSDTVCVVCTDNGCGIPLVHLKRLFEPFFTTKLGQGGSGLGLYVAYSLATDVLGGDIQVDSREGSGACFTLRLPRTAPVAVVELQDATI